MNKTQGKSLKFPIPAQICNKKRARAVRELFESNAF